ncbi:AlpA family phage regulatory protein [uncultured Pseudoteredinibacter sp.]|uniref:helix-turn-helix transcriptional regulator n=1 Tax=uncultured Pseudoteredinibacter sp. TaxID=1641701 RepID=UPI00260D3867|nr:AlpA family phage regulatory protein [uncultured Pseudoteredinibacter sp.]
MSERILRLDKVKEITGLSRSTIYAEISKGKFPKQVSLTGRRSVGWYQSDIAKWVDTRSK